MSAEAFVEHWDDQIDDVEEPENYESDEFLHGLLQFFGNLNRAVRVVCFGPYGNGKSSFIVTGATALSSGKQILKAIAPARASSDHVTKFVKDCPSGNVVLVDCPGISEMNYQDNQFVKILDGVLSHGMSLSDAAGHSKKRPSEQWMPIDAAVIVVDCVDFVDNVWVLERLNELITLLMDRGMVPMIALNKIDQLFEKGSKDKLGHVFREKVVKDRILKVSHDTGLPINQIFPCKSYNSERSRRVDVEKMVLFCLKETIEANLDRE